MLDELVGGLYGISKKELEVLECHFSMMQGRGHNSEENIENITDDEEE